MKYNYTLQKYFGPSSRHQCPSCKKKRVFTLYVDSNTNEPIARNVGRCNREIKCGYHFSPANFFEGNIPQSPQPNNKTNTTSSCELEPSGNLAEIPYKVFAESIFGYERNNFVQFLIKKVGVEKTTEALKAYSVGTSNRWPGATIFWQISISNKIKAGKIMLYNQTTGRRIKNPSNCIDWVHNYNKIDNYNLNQCLFGEHLLNSDRLKPVALVESEKTAVICHLYLPQFLWVATGGIHLGVRKCSALKDRRVFLFPDINAFDKWKKLETELSKIANVQISSLLEENTNDEERKSGFDLADYLLKFELEEFRFRTVIVDDIISRPEKDFNLIDQNQNHQIDEPISPNWIDEINKLESYFEFKKFPQSLKLNTHTTIINIDEFVKSHMSLVKTNAGKFRFYPYLSRLMLLKNILGH